MIVGFGRTPRTYSSQQLNLADRWARMGHSVDVITGQRESVDGAPLEPGVRLCLLNGRTVGGRLGLPVMTGLVPALRQKRYDMVLASEHYQPATAAACLASSRVVVYQGQNGCGGRRPARLGLALLGGTYGALTRSRALCAVAKTGTAANFLRRRGFASVACVPCGHDERRYRTPTPRERTAARAGFAVSDRQRVLAYAGNLLPRRDVGTAIRALGELVRTGRDALLLIAGDGPERVHLTSLVQELGLADRVQFLGHLPWHELRRAYWAGDAFVFPSRYEVFGMVLVEAMACGLAPLSTPVPAARDILEDGGNGFLFATGDWRGLAEKCDALFGSEDRLGRMKKAAVRTASRLTWTEVADRIMHFVRSELLARGLVPLTDAPGECP